MPQFLALLFLAAMFFAVPATAFACAAGSEVDEQGVRYVGYVFDQANNPVSDATVLVTRSNVEMKAGADGRFAHTENIEADSPSVIFVCKKPGFKSAQGVKKISPYVNRLVLVICTLTR